MRKYLELENAEVDVTGSLDINWMYPDAYGKNPKDQITISLYAVRAANDIIIKYDMKRDGWSISMDRTSPRCQDDTETADIIDEIAFVPAWSGKK